MRPNRCLASLVGLLAITSSAAGGRVDPVLHLNFDEGAGTVTVEQIGGEEGKIGTGQWTEGRFGKALTFNGKDSAVSFGRGDTIGATGTLELWVKPGTKGGTLLAYSAGGVHHVNNLLAIDYIASSESIRALSRWEGEAFPYHWYEETAKGSVPRDRWTLINLVQDGRNPKIYLNGKLAVEIKAGNQLKSWTNAPEKHWFNWLIGGDLRSGPDAGFFQGTIDEVRIYNRAVWP